MGTPPWLYYVFAVAMLSVAAYNASLFVLCLRARDPAGRDVDIAHIFMGVAMAGMFVSRWSFWPSWFWEIAFSVLLVWFVVRSALSIQRFGLHVPHQAIHAAMSLAMLLMYWYPMGSSASSAMSMSASSSSHGILDPGIGLIVAFAFFGSAIFTLASPNKGASHHGTHRALRSLVYAGAAAGARARDGAAEVQAEVPGAAVAVLAAPRLEDLSHVVMCVGMGFMLVLML